MCVVVVVVVFSRFLLYNDEEGRKVTNCWGISLDQLRKCSSVKYTYVRLVTNECGSVPQQRVLTYIRSVKDEVEISIDVSAVCCGFLVSTASVCA